MPVPKPRTIRRTCGWWEVWAAISMMSTSSGSIPFTPSYSLSNLSSLLSWCRPWRSPKGDSTPAWDPFLDPCASHRWTGQAEQGKWAASYRDHGSDIKMLSDSGLVPSCCLWLLRSLSVVSGGNPTWCGLSKERESIDFKVQRGWPLGMAGSRSQTTSLGICLPLLALAFSTPLFLSRQPFPHDINNESQKLNSHGKAHISPRVPRKGP